MISSFSETFRRMRHLLGIDRAVGFTVLARSWSVLSGALTVLLIARFLSAGEQGYYYTFAGLVSLQTVFELGFSFVVLQLAAHESSKLEIRPDGEILGDEVAHSRLASILKKSVRWYSVAALMMAATLIVAGIHFFSSHGQLTIPVAWKWPWISVVIAAIFTFQMDPVFSFLEGCGFVPQVARLRLAQAVTGSILAWLALTQHQGLFAPAGIILGQGVAGFAFLYSQRRILLPLLRHKSEKHEVGWRTEIWPFQWKIAVSCASCYLIFPLFSPVLFSYRGAVEAGRMGMSLTIANALCAMAQAWINTKASPFGNMVARRDFATLDYVFFRTLIQSALLLLVGDAIVMSALLFIAHHVPKLAARMLPMPQFALLLLSVFLNHIVLSEAVYLRAHKQEPFLNLSVVVGVLTGASTILTGRLWGVNGIILGYFLCGGVFYLIAGTNIFIRRRRLWHDIPDKPSVASRELV